MSLAAVLLSALLLCQGADDPKVADLIRDLGADDYATREKAQAELRKLGPAAAPALQRALEDKDAERALRAHQLLADLEKKEPQDFRRWTAYRDFSRGLTLETHPDGKVDLTLREPGAKESKTYHADSIEDFKKKYPEVAAKVDLDRLLPKEKWTFLEGSSAEGWDAWKQRFEKDWFWEKDPFGKFMLPWFPFGSQTLDRWMQEQRKQFEAFGKVEPPTAGTRRQELGVSVERAGSALADQLGLSPGEGLVIAEVQPGSAAARSGLRKYDVLVKMNGKAVTGPEDLRREVDAGLQSGLECEVLRRGKRETLKVSPAAPKSP
ncbi:MAG: PDZ domain-containing protein [Planctomycetaceae bacterium]|nr:PDZ domain-containing protein [Planctomycetaceae bacterium]